MKRHTLLSATALALLLAATACQEKADLPAGQADANVMTFRIAHPGEATRATDTAFEQGDRVGIFITQKDAPLEVSGNYVNNAALTFDGSQWKPERTIYWDEGTYNAYAYYPYISPITSIDDMPFSVNTDQRSASGIDGLDGYEASDFLYAKADWLSASSTPVPLTFRHIMSKLTVRLVKGEDFEGDMPTDGEVYIHNTVPTATIDLGAGVATASYVPGRTIPRRPVCVCVLPTFSVLHQRRPFRFLIL